MTWYAEPIVRIMGSYKKVVYATYTSAIDGSQVDACYITYKV